MYMCMYQLMLCRAIKTFKYIIYVHVECTFKREKEGGGKVRGRKLD